MPDTESTKRLEAKCHCGAVHFTVDVDRQQLPLPTWLCHCSLCRHTSGAPFVVHAMLDEDRRVNFVAPSSLANMTAYSSKGTMSWYFCSTCGCHITCMSHQKDTWAVSTSIFTDHGSDNFRFTKHIYSGSTGDGGLADLMPRVGGREMDFWNPPAGTKRAEVVEAAPEIGAAGEERLRAECQCGGVSLTFARPTKQTLDDAFFAGFVSPVDRSKWLATMDTCHDCRLVTGTHAIAWTLLPLSVIEPAIGADLIVGTAKTYSTTPGVVRSFCSTCGATAFYTCDDRRRDDGRQVVDLAMGLVRGPKGVMADDWFTWRSRIAWVESGLKYDESFTEALQEGMKEHVVKRCGRELTFSIG